MERNNKIKVRYMWALVTGASSGIGRDMSRYLYSLGYNLIIVARDLERLEKLKTELEKNKDTEINRTDISAQQHNDNNENNSNYKKTENTEINQKKQEIIIIAKDLSSKENCLEIYNQTKNIQIDLLVNNAGFGVFGEFSKTDLEKEINLINTNITALHILTKLYLQDMIKMYSFVNGELKEELKQDLTEVTIKTIKKFRI